jgi:hypothetical protein
MNNFLGALPQSGSTLTLATNANSLFFAYPFFRPRDTKNPMYSIAPIVLQIPRLSPARPLK